MAKRLTPRQKKWIERTVNNDRSYKAFVYNRALVCIFFLIVQLGVTVTLLMLGNFGWVWQLVVGVFSIAGAIYLAGREQRLPTRTLWIILLLALPFVGVPLYLLYGDGRTNYRMAKRYDAAHTILYTHAQEGANPAPASKQDKAQPLPILTLAGRMGCDAYSDGEITFYPTGKELYAEMITALKSAEKFIFLEYFILAGGKMWSEILAILLQKAAEGVQVKLIYDDFGSIFCLPPKYDKYLETLHPNIECLAFNKVYPIFKATYNHRDHKKILVVDGLVAFTGGVNIADEYIDEKKRFGYWKDTGVRITGGGARAFTKIFLETWIAVKDGDCDPAPYLSWETGGETLAKVVGDKARKTKKTEQTIIPFADNPLRQKQVSEGVLFQMISSAQKRLYITTPYLVLDELLRHSLCMAAARGVDVRIVTPGIPDKKTVYRLTRANYEGLLRAGVRIYEYTPGFLHAKQTLADDGAVVGTTNYDYRSLYLHFENGVYFQGCDAVESVEKDFGHLFLSSKEQTISMRKRGVFGRVFDTFLRVFEPLL